MISRNRVYNAAGGLIAVQSQLRRVKLARYVQGQLIDHMQAIYRHEQFALALYQAFAARANSPVQRNLFLRLAQLEKCQIARRIAIFDRLSIPVPPCGTWSDRFRRRVLIVLGPRCALKWLQWVKKSDVCRQLELARLLKLLSEQESGGTYTMRQIR